MSRLFELPASFARPVAMGDMTYRQASAHLLAEAMAAFRKGELQGSEQDPLATHRFLLLLLDQQLQRANLARLAAFERVVNAVWRQVKRGRPRAECQSAAEAAVAAAVGVRGWLRPEEIAETVQDTLRTARRQQRKQGQ